ncbi:BTAD domain-containing putative transcriptional regulator [Kribbella sp. CA-247076]|uniref:AfsR/SARP family transcriptional regulator n=1 Tax=Kribbella sp. CA-247076 TaxID=3239941 RepID=UPI003D8DF719
MTPLEIGLLGPLRVVVGGEAIALPGERLPVLLAVLAMSAGEAVPAERIATAVWGLDSGVDARTNVQSNVRRLRRLLGDSAVQTRGAGYALAVAPEAVDTLRFGELLDAGRVEDALTLWRGEPFDGLRSDWLDQAYGVRLRERYVDAVEQRGDLAALVELADRYPLRESLWARLLEALRSEGRDAEALEWYEQLRRRLADELGVDPSAELRDLHASLLAGELSARAVPRQLPADPALFSGRETELAALDALPQGPVVISGTAGVGKTTLAVHWAHRIADRYPDGQLYVDLRGFDPSEPPLAPSEALRGFLEALGVPRRQVPTSPSAQAALYRSLLADTRTLVVLDNARDAGQVAPLLPGAPGCSAVVTSRNQLAGLVTSAGARPLTLDLLDVEAAQRLLAARLGPARADAESDDVARLAARCAGLPLALAIVAARAVLQPGYALAALEAELAEAGLDGFDAGDPMSSARAVFSWSYRSLSEPAARVFQLLALHPGPDVGLDAAASLAGGDVRRELAELARAHLVVEQTPGRYAFHDLLRAYARELGAGDDTALTRMLDHYVHTARAADRLLFSHGETIPVDAPAYGVVVPALGSEDEAMAWFETERPALLALLRLDEPAYVCQLAWATHVYLHRQGHWHDRIAAQHAAVEAARRLGSAAAESRSRRFLGFAYADLGRFADAHMHLDRALALASDPVDRAWTQHYRDLTFGLQGDQVSALEAARSALELFREAGEVAGEAMALSNVAWYSGRLGALTTAVADGKRALALHRQVGNRAYDAHTLTCLAEMYTRTGQVASAEAAYREALAVFAELGDRFGEASTYAHLAQLVGDSEARRRAEAILRELDPPAAVQLQSLLA